MTRRPGSLLILGLLLLLPTLSATAQVTIDAPDTNPTGLDLLNGIENSIQPERISTTLAIMVLLTVLTMAPAILLMTTSFTRIIVVLGFMRQAMATQQSPPNQVLVGLALILTFLIMAPTYQAVYEDAVLPYSKGEITQAELLENGMKPIRDFMFRQASGKDMALFLEIAKLERPETPDDVPTVILIPAFILGELRKAFTIGFFLYIPFLIVDMVVASTLMSMGMMMLPPVFVSLPFKIIMFVLADGWGLLFGSLAKGFR